METKIIHSIYLGFILKITFHKKIVLYYIQATSYLLKLATIANYINELEIILINKYFINFSVQLCQIAIQNNNNKKINAINDIFGGFIKYCEEKPDIQDDIVPHFLKFIKYYQDNRIPINGKIIPPFSHGIFKLDYYISPLAEEGREENSPDYEYPLSYYEEDGIAEISPRTIERFVLNRRKLLTTMHSEEYYTVYEHLESQLMQDLFTQGPFFYDGRKDDYFYPFNVRMYLWELISDFKDKSEEKKGILDYFEIDEKSDAYKLTVYLAKIKSLLYTSGVGLPDDPECLDYEDMEAPKEIIYKINEYTKEDANTELYNSISDRDI